MIGLGLRLTLAGGREAAGRLAIIAAGVALDQALGQEGFASATIGEQQVVVKPLPNYINNFNVKQRGITGCTILGDGNISVILDVSNLYSAVQ